MSSVPNPIRRVAVLFSGGPAPAANAVISTAAVSFLRQQVEVIGILNGYSNLVQFSSQRPLEEGRDYIRIDNKFLKRSRNSRGVMLGTARTNPGKAVKSPAQLADPACTAPLRAAYDALVSLGVDALISIGGDDTLKSANMFQRFQEHLPAGSRRIRVVHLPKTIDNDYTGIDFTFGYFTAVDALAKEVLNLLADAESSKSYYLVEAMGRNAGWLAYGGAIAGEASLVISVEDLVGKYVAQEEVAPTNGKKRKRMVMDVDAVVRHIVALMRAREDAERKEFGVVIMAEGLSEFLPAKILANASRDEHGHIAFREVNLYNLFANLVAAEYERQTGRKRRVIGVQLGYEARCSAPAAFDVILGSQLGVGAYRALVERSLDGVMVSVAGQFELRYLPFDELIDPQTLLTKVRYIPPDSDFHRLARFLETHVNE